MKNKITRVLLCLVIAALLVPMASFFTVAEEIDCSTSGALNKTTLAASDLLLELFGDEDGFNISDAERIYINKYSSDSLSYGTLVPSDRVNCEYNVADGTLTVEARSYDYVSVSGVSMHWTPSRVTFGTYSEPLAQLSSDTWYAVLSEVDSSAGASVDVLYTASITLSEQMLNSLRNKAYDDAVGWIRYEEYTVALAEYEQLLDVYEKYLDEKYIYNENYRAYVAYLDEKKKYDEALSLYNEYLEKLEKYNADYALYTEYLEEKAEYDRHLLAYNSYVSGIETVKDQLAVMDALDNSLPTLGRPLYGAIMGPTVSEVIDNKDAIANELTGLDGQVVDIAGETTEIIRAILSNYFNLETEAEKYAFYCTQYVALRDAFNLLFRTLDHLYSNGKVRYALAEKGLKDKYEILLAQLYFVTLALNESLVPKYDGSGYFDYSYKIGSSTPLSIVEGVPYVPDKNNSVPLSTGYPKKVDEPTYVTPVAEPTRPTKVSEPVEPTQIEDPGEPPVEVLRPDAPERVTPPNSKLILSDKSIHPDAAALVLAYRGGEIVRRDEIVGSRTLTVYATATRSITSIDLITVYFYSEDGAELLDTVVTERGGYAEFSGVIPEKTAPDKNYTFAGWTDGNGRRVDTSSINPDGTELSLYASYRGTNKIFTVSFNVNGTVYSEQYYYGETPIYIGRTPSRTPTSTHVFVFIGWDKPIAPVTEDAVYVALFEAIPIESDEPDEPETPPAEPDEPDEPETPPTDPDEPGEPDTPPTEPDEPGEPDTPPAEPDEPDEPDTPPAEPEEPDEPDIPPTEPDEPGEPDTPPTEPEEPDEPFVPTDPYTVDISKLGMNRFAIYDLLAYVRQYRVGLVIKLSDGTVAISFSQVLKCIEAGVEEVEIISNEIESVPGAHTFSLLFYDADGAVISTRLQATLTLPYTFVNSEFVKVGYSDGNKTVYENTAFGEGNMTLTVRAGLVYTAVEEYILTSYSNDSAKIYVTFSLGKAAPGQTVGVEMKLPYGVRIGSVYYLTPDGDRVVLDGGEIVMPAYDVEVKVEYEYILYTVEFVVDGKVISTSSSYRYGEMPDVPKNPRKAADTNYTYRFVRWSPKVSEVTCDTTYTAEFEMTPIVKAPPKDGLQITDSVLKTIVTLFVLGIYAVAVALPSLVIVVVKILRIRARRVKKRAKNDSKK